jgi:hypothetical protein
MVWYRTVTYRIVSHRIASHRIASHRIASHRIVMYCNVSHHFDEPEQPHVGLARLLLVGNGDVEQLLEHETHGVLELWVLVQ